MQDGALANIAALSYTLVAYLAGWALILWSGGGILSALFGVALLAHARVYSAYLLHDLMHGTILRRGADSARLATLLMWMSGGCYSSYDALRAQHLRHHALRVDVIQMDYKVSLRRLPRPLLWLVLSLEWAYVPVVEFILFAHAFASPFRTKDGGAWARLRACAILAARVGLLLCAAAVSVRAPLLYLLAVIVSVNVLRIMDAHQHTYDVLYVDPGKGPGAPRRDRAYEQAHTYSNLLSSRFPWLNLLVLNFCYHNAHHAQPSAPWHRLPEIHRALSRGSEAQVLPLRSFLGNYHRHRVRRVLSSDGDMGAGNTQPGFLGGVGLSFLY